MNPQTLTLKIDFRIISLVLLAIIIGMFAFWRPWEASASTRKITIPGEATVEAVPDEFVFYPYFQRTGDDLDALKKELDTFGTKLLNDLKGLGVPEENIKLDSSAYDYGRPIPLTEEIKDNNVSLSATITVGNKELAQKVQDYLQTTDAKGQLTPQGSFSKAKQKELEQKARSEAIADARKKAAQTANELDAKLGKVVEIKDTQGAITLPWFRAMDTQVEGGPSTSSLPVTPGKNSFDFQVEVIFELR